MNNISQVDVKVVEFDAVRVRFTGVERRVIFDNGAECVRVSLNQPWIQTHFWWSFLSRKKLVCQGFNDCVEVYIVFPVLFNRG
ncbi:hypothetical protein Hanom_Chr07g00627671 [Helianthus anomalus]